MTAPTRIGIAVVECCDQFLVGTRDSAQTLAGMAEFPGGKCMLNEAPQDCAVRECLEETGLPVRAEESLQTLRWSYAHGEVELHFWRCRLKTETQAPPEPRAPFHWVTQAELKQLRFPDANNELVLRLTTNV